MNVKSPEPKVENLHVEYRGWFVIDFGFIGFLIWAALYPIDQGIHSSGYVISGTKPIDVTSPMPATIKHIYKKDGDRVVTGDVVMELNVQPVEPQDRNTLNLIKQLEASNNSLKNAHVSLQQQVAALEIQYQSIEQLLASGFATKNYLSSIEVQLASSRSESFQIKSRMEENETKLRELKERINALRVSPISGTLINLGSGRIGGQIQVGDKLFSVQPSSIDLLVSIRIPVDYVTQIKNGLSVNIIFPTIPGGMAVNFEGRLDHVSNDRMVDDKTNASYFNGIVAIPNTPRIEELQIKNGLPVSVIIKAGHRSLLSYITRPFMERLMRGLR